LQRHNSNFWSESGAVTTGGYTGEDAPEGLGQFTGFDNTFSVSDTGQVAYVGYYTGATSGVGVFL